MKPKKPRDKSAVDSKHIEVTSDAIDDLLRGIRSLEGDDAAQLLGSSANMTKIRGVISTQCPTLDMAIGRGGIPLARTTILHGDEGCGKTTLALHLVAECQANEGQVVYIDKEYKLDPDYAAALGVDTKKFIISQPSTLEKVISTIKGVILIAKARREKFKRRVPILIVVDSINSCIAKAVLEGEVEDHHVAPEARIWSRNLPKIIEDCSREDVALLLISQVRTKIGVMYGSKDELAGGKAPRFYASLILKFERVGTQKSGDTKTGSKTEVTCVKNQVAAPFKVACFNIMYGTGIDFDNALLRACVELKIVKQTGGNLAYNGEIIGKGLVGATAAVSSNEVLRGKLYAQFRKAMGWDAVV